jgi:protein MpaA
VIRGYVVVAVTVLAVAVTSAPAEAADGAAGAAAVGVPRAAGSAPARATPYAATPPVGITCRAATDRATTLTCVIGRSVAGRAIVARRQGDATAPRVLLVNGQMHGEEWPGRRSVKVLRGLRVPAGAGYQVWTISTINPDGSSVGRRRNNRGVDLNRNFDAAWSSALRDSGRRPASEPETRALVRFLRWTQPDLVLSLHGFSESVDTTGGGQRAAWARDFSRISGIRPATRVPCGAGPCHGNMTDWYSRVSTSGGVAVTVEMPRSSARARACRVPGRAARATPIRCVAWASLDVARRLPA